MRRVRLSDLQAMAAAAGGRISRVFLHWSAGHYGQPFADYHVCIDGGGEIYAMHDDLTKILAHTWQHNTAAIGISLLCCVGATTKDLGVEPPTEAQIETMAQVVAVLCPALGIPCDYSHVRTHAEQADLDGYGPATTCERWDLWFLQDGDVPGTGGDTLRGKANWYMENGVGI